MRAFFFIFYFAIVSNVSAAPVAEKTQMNSQAVGGGLNLGSITEGYGSEGGYAYPSFVSPELARELRDKLMAIRGNVSQGGCALLTLFFTGSNDSGSISPSGSYSSIEHEVVGAMVVGKNSNNDPKSGGSSEVKSRDSGSGLNVIDQPKAISLKCVALNTWFRDLQEPKKAKVFSAVQAFSYHEPEIKTLAELIMTDVYFKKQTPPLYEVFAAADACDWKATLSPTNIQSLTSSGYGRVLYSAIDSYYAGSTESGCVKLQASNNGLLVGERLQSTIVESAGAVVDASGPENFFIDGSLEAIYSGGVTDARTLALWDAQQTAHQWGNKFLEEQLSRSLLQSIGVANPQLDRVAPTSGTAIARSQVNVVEQSGYMTSLGNLNTANGIVNVNVSPEFYVPYIYGGSSQNPLSAYASAASLAAGEIATWMTQNLIPWVGGVPAQIHDEALVMAQIPNTVSGIAIGDAVERIAYALTAGLDSRQPLKLASPVPGADRFGQFIYGHPFKALRLGGGVLYNDGYANYPWRFHLEQSLAPLYTPQVVLENGMGGAMATTRDGVSPPLPNANLTEFLSTMDFGSEAFVNVFMRMSEFMGQKRAWRIWLRAINRLCEGRSCNYTTWNLRQFAKDMMAATTALYGSRYLPATEYALLLHGFPTADSKTVQMRMHELFPPAPGVTLRGNAGSYSSFAAAQPGITFAQATNEVCNWYADRTALPSGGEAPLYMTYQMSPFSMMGAGDRFDMRRMGSAPGNNPSMDGELVVSAKDLPIEGVTLFADVTTRADYAYYRCLSQGLVDPSTGFGLMNWDVRPSGFNISNTVANGFAVTMTTLGETEANITVRLDIKDPSDVAEGGPYTRTYNWSIDSSNLTTPFTAAGRSITRIFPKDEFVTINVSRATGGSPRGSTKLFMATNSFDTYPTVIGREPSGATVSDSTGRASFLFGKPVAIWGSSGVGTYMLTGGPSSGPSMSYGSDLATDVDSMGAGEIANPIGNPPSGPSLTPIMGSEAPL